MTKITAKKTTTRSRKTSKAKVGKKLTKRSTTTRTSRKSSL